MIVTEPQVIQALKHWEREFIKAGGKLDGVSIPKECSRLADLLGVMWFRKESQADVPDDSQVAELLRAAI